MKKLIAYWPAILISLVPSIGLADISTLTGVQTTIQSVFGVFITVFWVIAVAFALWTAVSYLTAGGDPEKVKKAKQRLIFTIIAFAIAITVNVVRLLLADILGGGGAPSTTW